MTAARDCALTPADVQRLLVDPSAEMRIRTMTKMVRDLEKGTFDEREKARFLAFEEFFDDHWAVAGSVDRHLRFLLRHGDGHALPRREAVGLDHHWNAELLECVMRRRRSVDADVSGRRDSVRGTQILGEALRAFELGRRGVRSEHGYACLPEGVAHTCDQRCFGTNHHKVDRLPARELRHRRRIARIDRHALRPASDPRVAGRGYQLVTARRLPQAPGKRILAAARTQKQDIHGSPRRQ